MPRALASSRTTSAYAVRGIPTSTSFSKITSAVQSRDSSSAALCHRKAENPRCSAIRDLNSSGSLNAASISGHCKPQLIFQKAILIMSPVESVELFVETMRGTVRSRFKCSVVCSNSGSIGFASTFNSSNERKSDSRAAETPVKATKQTTSRNPFRMYIVSAVLVPLVCPNEGLSGIRNADCVKFPHANQYYLGLLRIACLESRLCDCPIRCSAASPIQKPTGGSTMHSRCGDPTGSNCLSGRTKTGRRGLKKKRSSTFAINSTDDHFMYGIQTDDNLQTLTAFADDYSSFMAKDYRL